MKRRVILRPGRRLTAWQDDGDPRTAAEIEFPGKGGGIDLEPSVYVLEVESEELGKLAERVLAEHHASGLNKPPGVVFAVDLEGICPAPIPEERASAKFGLTRSSHHFLKFGALDELADLVMRVRQDKATRIIESSREALLEYAESRLNAIDEEWKAAYEGQLGSGWKEKIDKRRADRDRKEKERVEAERRAAEKEKGRQHYERVKANPLPAMTSIPQVPDVSADDPPVAELVSDPKKPTE
jgi:hypothetical protein